MSEMNINENGNGIKFTSQKLGEAMDRVSNSENFKFLQMLEKQKDLIKLERSIQSLKLQAERELYLTHERNENGDSPSNEDEIDKEKTQLREERDHLHATLVKHQSLTTTFQNAIFKTQIQKNFHNNLKHIDEATANPEVMTTLEAYDENLSVSSELSKKTSEGEELEKKLLMARLKYIDLLESIEGKWKVILQLKGQESSFEYPSDNPELKNLEQKASRRQERLHLLVHLLQNMISASGEKWGGNETVLDIMLLCDSVARQIDGNEEILEGISKLKLSKEDEKRIRKRKKSIEQFISSTPK